METSSFDGAGYPFEESKECIRSSHWEVKWQEKLRMKSRSLYLWLVSSYSFANLSGLPFRLYPWHPHTRTRTHLVADAVAHTWWLMQWWELSHWVTRSWVRSSLSTFAGEDLPRFIPSTYSNHVEPPTLGLSFLSRNFQQRAEVVLLFYFDIWLGCNVF